MRCTHSVWTYWKWSYHVSFLLFTSLVHFSMKLNHKYNVKSYINCLLQTKNGEPLPEDEWPSQDDWKDWYPELFPDSSSELKIEQEQVGHRLKVNRAIVLPVFFLNPFQFTCFSNLIYCNVLYVICFKKVILKTSLIARTNLFFCSSDIFKQNRAFLDHWTWDPVFKLTGTVVLLVSVAGRQCFAMS